MITDMSVLGNNSYPSAIETENNGQLTVEGGGWQAVGYLHTNGHLIVASRLTGSLVELGASLLSEREVLLRFGQSVVCQYQEWSESAQRDVFNPIAFAADVQRSCLKLGQFRSEQIRGPGIYRNGRGLIINTGASVHDELLRPVDVTPKLGGYVYVSGKSLGIDLRAEIASTEDVKAFMSALESFRFVRAGSSQLLAGWTVMVTLAQALNYRPSIQLSADRACGKTTLLELLARVLGDQLISREGIPTKPQVQRELEGGRCAALAIDECEPRGASAKAFDDIAELARSGFTGLKAGGRAAKVLGGQLRYFNAPTGVLMAGIALPMLNPASESRMVRVDLLPRGGAGDDGAARATASWLFDSERGEEVEALGRRLRALAVGRWPVIRDTYTALLNKLRDVGHDDRQAGKFATLLACYVGLVNKRVPAASELEKLLEVHDLLVTEAEAEVNEALMCVDHLLQQRIVVTRVVDGEMKKEVSSVRAVIGEVVNGKSPEREALARKLHDFGLRVVVDSETKAARLAVCSSPRTQRLATMFSATDWARGGWANVLARLPGAKRGHARLSAVSAPRVVFIELNPEWLKAKLDADLYDAMSM